MADAMIISNLADYLVTPVDEESASLYMTTTAYGKILTQLFSKITLQPLIPIINDEVYTFGNGDFCEEPRSQIFPNFPLEFPCDMEEGSIIFRGISPENIRNESKDRKYLLLPVRYPKHIALVVILNDKEAYYMEPNGDISYYGKAYAEHCEGLVADYLTMCGYEYVPIEFWNYPLFRPNVEREGQVVDGNCCAFTMMFSQLIMYGMSPTEIFQGLRSMSDEDLKNLINSYTNYLYSNITEYIGM